MFIHMFHIYPYFNYQIMLANWLIAVQTAGVIPVETKTCTLLKTSLSAIKVTGKGSGRSHSFLTMIGPTFLSHFTQLIQGK